MKRTCIITALLLGCAITMIGQTEQLIKSPDGRMTITVTDEGGRPSYQVSLDGTEYTGRSPLGLKTNQDDLTQGLKMKQCDIKPVSIDYTLQTTKQSHVSHQATEATCQFEKDGRRALDIIFHVTSRDVALRYKVYPKGETLAAIIEHEATGVVLPVSTTGFLCPQAKPMTGFARTAPSYETQYELDMPVNKGDGSFNRVQSGREQSYTFPCLFRTPANGGDHWLLISETGTDGGYVGCRLLMEQPGCFRFAFPQAGEMNGWGSTTPAVTLPCLTPWRTLTIGTTLQNIVETTISNDVVEPKYKASYNYTYGKGTWSWIIGMDPSCNYDEQRRYIDFAAAMGYRSVLIDALWDVQIGYDRIAQLSRYAKEKGVGLFLWYNSNGTWNDAPQSPKNKMDRSAPRRKEMKWMQDNGILGIKVDFFGGDKQPMMQLYEDILTDANDFGLQVIFHGCTLPRGWERMYPNYVASEAVLASENMHFAQGACDAEARNAAIHPFIRNTVGSMDFGGSTLNKHYNVDNKRGTTRRTSDVFALATAVLFQSSVQHFALAPNNMDDAPAWAIDFMKQVPTTWDEVRFIDGYPGRYVIMARRSGSKWYVAGINAQEAPVKTSLQLPFLMKGTEMSVYTDDATLNGSMKQQKLKSTTAFKVEIPQNGAFVIVGDALL